MAQQGSGEAQHVALPTAAAVVYEQVTGQSAHAGKAPAETQEILNRVAHAIANIAPIWTSDRPTGTPRQLAPIELIHCKFERGAALLRTGFGVEYGNLSIRRGDLHSAIAILKGAGVRFERRRDP